MASQSALAYAQPLLRWLFSQFPTAIKLGLSGTPFPFYRP